MIKCRYKQLCLTCRLRYRGHEYGTIPASSLHSWFRLVAIHSSGLRYPFVGEEGGQRLLCVYVEYVLTGYLKQGVNRRGVAEDGWAPISEKESQKDSGHLPAGCHDCTMLFSLHLQACCVKMIELKQDE